MLHPKADATVTEVHEYGFLCTFDGNGEIYNRDNKMLWRFKTIFRNSRPVFPCSVFRLLPDFILYDTDSQELLTIRCEQGYPLPRFVMIDNDSSVCTIKQMSILQNKYIIEFNSGYKWTFKIPLFTVFYKGVSESGVEVQVRMQRHDTWHVQIPSNIDNLRLVAAFAFLHREQQR
jgi:uncharacterized protein YxjI